MLRWRSHRKLKANSDSILLKDIDCDEMVVYEAIAWDKALSIAFLKRPDRDRFGTLLDSLEN